MKLESNLKMLYLRPSFGGVYDYSKSIEAIFRENIREMTVNPMDVQEGYLIFLPALFLTLRILQLAPSVIYLELGAGDRRMFWAAWLLTRLANFRLFITVHDPQVVVRGPFVFKVMSRLPRPIPGLGFRMAKVLNRMIGRNTIDALLESADAILCLNPEISTIREFPVIYLPQPTYARKPLVLNQKTKSSTLRIGYVGFWGREKGLETLADAIEILQNKHIDATFIVSGGGAFGGDPFCSNMQKRIVGLGENVETPGFIDPSELDSFIASLDLMVLPYWQEVPGASSGNVMRAMEAGVPIVATKTKSLLNQLGEGGAFYAEPKDPGSLADMIEQATKAPKQRRQMAELNQKRVYNENSWEKVAAVLAATLQEGAKI